MSSPFNQSTVVIYKPISKKKSKSKIKKSAKYSSLNLSEEYDDQNISEEEEQEEEDHHSIINDNASKHSKSSTRKLIFSRSKTSKLSTHSKSSKKSGSRTRREKSKSKSHRSMKSLTKSIHDHKSRDRSTINIEKKEDNINDNIMDALSQSSKSFSVKTFYRNRRSRNRNNSSHTGTHTTTGNGSTNRLSLNSNISLMNRRPLSTKSKSKSSKIERSTNWRCDQCNYLANHIRDPHCCKCGAMKNDMGNEAQNKPRKRTFSMTGTTSSSPLFAPGGSSFHHSSNQNNIIVHSSDNTTDNTTGDSSGSSSSSSDCDSSSDSSSSNTSMSDGKAIIVEDYRSRTSKTNSHSRLAIANDSIDIIDIDANNIALPAKIKIKNANPKSMIEMNEMNGMEHDHEYDSDSSSDSNSDSNVVVSVPHTHLRKRRVSLDINNKFNNLFNAFSSDKNGYISPKIEEWNAFQWYLGFKRFILAILYFILTIEETFILIHIKYWLVLPLLLCIVYLLLIIYIGRFNAIKYNYYTRTICLIIFYFLNVLIIIGPPMNVLIASSLVYDFNDILKRHMLYNNLMWITFGMAILSMVFIDIIIVHNGTNGKNIKYKNDKYRVETFKLAIVKDEEYVLNNQCLWYTVPRKDWGNYKIDYKNKKKKKNNNENIIMNEGKNEGKNNSTKSFFIPIGSNKNENINANNNENKTEEDESSDDFDMDTSDEEENQITGVQKIKKNKHKIDINNDCDRKSHSMTNMINNNRDNKILRCCKEPFSAIQWILVCVFFISLQICVVFSNLDTKLIEKYDAGEQTKMIFGTDLNF